MEGFFFVSEKIGKTKKGSKAFVRTKVPARKNFNSTVAVSPTSSTETVKSTVAEKAPSPPPAASPTAAVAAATASASPSETPAPASPTAAPASPKWTEAEDTTLYDMKQENKSWKEIEDALPGKGDRGQLKLRWRDLMVAKANAKDEKKPPKADEKKDESSSEKGGKDGSGSQKGGKKGKGGDGKGDGKGDDKAVGKKSNLKQPSEKKDDGELKKLGDRPIIYMDTGDQLDADQLASLYKYHAKAEKAKWIEISSRFFDKTGRRIDPAVLRDKLGNC